MYGMVGNVCSSCDEKIFPPKDICPGCKADIKEEYQFIGRGEVFSYTTIFEAPTGFDEQAPYTVALIKTEEGPLVTAQLTDLDPNDEIFIGMQVEMVTRKLSSNGEQGVITYGYKFRPR